MDRREFDDSMFPLKRKYAKNVYDPTTMDLIFKACRDLTVQDFRSLVLQFIKDRKKPTVRDFEQQMAKIRVARTYSHQTNCGLCGGGGWIVPRDAPVGAEIIPMRCECSGGPESIANSLREKKQFDKANEFEKFWKGMSAADYRHAGYQLMQYKMGRKAQ